MHYQLLRKLKLQGGDLIDESCLHYSAQHGGRKFEKGIVNAYNLLP